MASCATICSTVLRRHAFERARHRFLAKAAELLEQRPRRGGQEQPLGAAISRIGPALDQTAVAELVEQPGQRDRLQIEHFGQLRLVEALEAIEPDQHRPLGAGHPELRRLVVGIGPQQARYIIENKGEFSVLAKAGA